MFKEQYKSEFLDEFVESGDIKGYEYLGIYEEDPKDEHQVLILIFSSGKKLTIKSTAYTNDYHIESGFYLED